MTLSIDLDFELDGRWIAEVPELNILLYATSKQDAIQRARQAAHEIILDKIAHGELPPDAANPVFDQAASGIGGRALPRPPSRRLLKAHLTKPTSR